MNKLVLIVVALLFNFFFSNAQVFNKESLGYRIEESKKFGDSIKIPVYSSQIWGLKDSGFYFLKKEDKWCLKDENKNKLVIPYEIDSVFTVFHSPNIKSYIIKRHGKWECIAFNKKFKIKRSEPDTGLTHDAYKKNGYDIDKRTWRRFMIIFNGKRGIMNKNYETIIAPKYDYILSLNNHLTEETKDSLSYILYNNNKVGFVSNATRIEPKYDDIGLKYPTYYGDYGSIKLFDDKGYFGVLIDGKMGLMNYKEELLIPAVYDELLFCKPNFDSSTKDLFVVKKKGKYGVLDSKNNSVVPITYNYLSFKGTYSGVAHFMVRNKMNYGIINDSNDIVKPLEFTKEELEDF